MNKLERNSMKKIISYIFIAHIAFMASNSVCMLTVLTKSKYRSSKTTLYSQQRGFGSIPILSKERYRALLKKNKTDKEKLRLLKQRSDSNPKEIDKLQRLIGKNRLFLMTCQIDTQTTLFDDTTQ